jgi:hypothetical protein
MIASFEIIKILMKYINRKLYVARCG